MEVLIKKCRFIGNFRLQYLLKISFISLKNPLEGMKHQIDRIARNFLKRLFIERLLCFILFSIFQ